MIIENPRWQKEKPVIACVFVTLKYDWVDWNIYSFVWMEDDDHKNFGLMWCDSEGEILGSVAEIEFDEYLILELLDENPIDKPNSNE